MKEMNWIPFEKCFPESGKDVLLCFDNGIIAVGHGNETFINGISNRTVKQEGYISNADEWHIISDIDDIDFSFDYSLYANYRFIHALPIAWMPLPEPYKMKGC